MKTILVPVDFSPASYNAVEYAAGMALNTKSKLILFHVYNNTPPALDVPMIIPTWKEIEKDSIKELKQIKKKIELKYGEGLIIKSTCKSGFIIEEINNFAKENKVDLIVMGMQGAGFLQEYLVGSTTTALMRKSHCPVLSIYQGIQFKPLKKIVLACDYDELDAESVLLPLKEFVNIFNANVYVLHVIPEFDLAPTLAERVKVKRTLAGMRVTFHGIVEGSIVSRINSFVTQHGADMVVMIPRQHLFIDNIFFEPDTKRMAFHSKVPLLALHE